MIDHAHLRLFQFCDSQFPTGAFSHSFGLETYIQRDTVHDEESFQQWLVLFLNEQLTYADGLTMRLVYDALNENDTKAILKLDRILFVQNLPKETRQGSKQMGNRMVKLASELYDSDWINWYHDQMKDKKHPCILQFALQCLVTISVSISKPSLTIIYIKMCPVSLKMPFVQFH